MSQILSAALGVPLWFFPNNYEGSEEAGRREVSIPLWFFQQEQGKGCDGAVIGFKGALDP